MIDLQIATKAGGLPNAQQLETWVALATQETTQKVAQEVLVTIRLVDDDESQALNSAYRSKDIATNILSFPQDLSDVQDPNILAALHVEQSGQYYLGDLVINAPLVAQEAAQQNKPVLHHFAHLVIHGCLHLQGYDHIEEAQAYTMETLEVELLAQLGIVNPYR